jgi:hypothetical protein
MPPRLCSRWAHSAWSALPRCARCTLPTPLLRCAHCRLMEGLSPETKLFVEAFEASSSACGAALNAFAAATGGEAARLYPRLRDSLLARLLRHALALYGQGERSTHGFLLSETWCKIWSICEDALFWMRRVGPGGMLLALPLPVPLIASCALKDPCHHAGSALPSAVVHHEARSSLSTSPFHFLR